MKIKTQQRQQTADSPSSMVHGAFRSAERQLMWSSSWSWSWSWSLCLWMWMWMCLGLDLNPGSSTWNLDLGTRAPADALSACSWCAADPHRIHPQIHYFLLSKFVHRHWQSTELLDTVVSTNKQIKQKYITKGWECNNSSCFMMSTIETLLFKINILLFITNFLYFSLEQYSLYSQVLLPWLRLKLILI